MPLGCCENRTGRWGGCWAGVRGEVGAGGGYGPEVVYDDEAVDGHFSSVQRVYESGCNSTTPTIQ
jgi:hypothetical protein